MYESIGRLHYYPVVSNDIKDNPWWLVVQCCDDLIKYYRWLVLKATGIKLAKPAWGAHISVIRGEKPPTEELWEKYQGKSISFLYSPIIYTDKKYWWLDVEAPFLLDIRQECGLKREPEFALHLTVGLMIAG